MQTSTVATTRRDGRDTRVACKAAAFVDEIDPAGRRDAYAPVEPLRAAIAACMIEGGERITPLLGFPLRGSTATPHVERQAVPPLTRGGVRMTVTTNKDA